MVRTLDKPIYILWLSVTDHRNDEVTVYKYDRTGRLDSSYTYNSETMLNQSGISMSYDVWGVCTAQGVSGNSAFETNLLELYNPFRYRGYFCDAESLNLDISWFIEIE
ncbi:MAG: hypothetical protein E7620_00340 [Ruminococcaceae bacterium]|nr:hypothetical protein [Oscillospiraceae bacterium]